MLCGFHIIFDIKVYDVIFAIKHDMSFMVRVRIINGIKNDGPRKRFFLLWRTEAEANISIKSAYG